VHPFDDPTIVIGQGTVGLELLEDAEALDAVVVPIGGAASSPASRWRSRRGRPRRA
jgi:threonine dehydratase